MATVEENEDSIVVTVDEPDFIVISDIGDSLEVNDVPDEINNIVDAPIVSITQINGIGQLTSKQAFVDIPRGSVVAVENEKYILADHTIITTVNAVVGIATQDTLAGNLCEVAQIGKVQYNSWSWTQDLPLFVSTAGEMTQTPPTTGYSLIVGVAVTPTEINFEIKTPVVL